MSAPTFKIVLRKDKARVDGACPVHIRGIMCRKVNYISTGVVIPPKYWDEKNRQVRRGYPNAARVNHFLQTKLNKYIDEALKAETSIEPFTIKKFKDVLTGKSVPTFIDYAEEILARYKAKGNIGTYDKSVSVIKKLRAYTRNAPLSFQDIDPRFLAQYEVYLSKHHKNSVNTIAKDLKFIRTIFNYAIKERLIDSEISPFRAHKISLEPTTKVFLELHEIELLKAFNGTYLMNLCRDIVLFQYYAGGIRISDALLLRWDAINNGYISLKIKKTGAQLSHRLTDSALSILKNHWVDINPKERVFGFVPANIDDTDNIRIDNAISKATALINKVIKQIAKKVGINKPISTHSFRHSFAINAIRKGIPVEYVQKILGHANIRETMVYARVQNNEVNDHLYKFDK